MKILHIIPAETTYMYSFLKMMSWQRDWQDEHIYYAMLSKPQAIKSFPKLLAMKELIYLENTTGVDKKFKEALKQADKIIWHSLVKICQKYKRFLSKHPSIMEKSYWCMGGPEIEYLQKEELNIADSYDYWLELFLKKLTIISPIELYNELIQKYAEKVIPGEYPYPYRYNRQVESVLIDQLGKEKAVHETKIAQIGLSGHIVNEHDKILKRFESEFRFEDKSYCIPIKYADYVVGNSIEKESIGRIFDFLRERNCRVVLMNTWVSSYDYLRYLHSISEVHVAGIPASAISSLIYLGYLNKDVYYYGNNPKLKELNFHTWARKELDIEYDITQWKKLFKAMRDEK